MPSPSVPTQCRFVCLSGARATVNRLNIPKPPSDLLQCASGVGGLRLLHAQPVLRPVLVAEGSAGVRPAVAECLRDAEGAGLRVPRRGRPAGLTRPQLVQGGELAGVPPELAE